MPLMLRTGNPMKPVDVTPSTFAQVCPLCRGENHCAMTIGQAHETCWCHQPTVEIKAEWLESLPDEIKGQVCLCQRCIDTLAKQAENNAL